MRAILLLTAVCVHAQTFESARLSGQVRDMTGAGIPGAVVQLQMPGSAVQQRSVTDQHGGFALDALTAGEYDLTAESSGFETLRVKSITISKGEGKMLPPLELKVSEVAACRDGDLHYIRLLPSPTARGSVVGSVKPAVPGAEVTLRCGGYTGTACAKTRTSADGVFRFDGVAPGPVGVWISATGFYPLQTYDLRAKDGIESWFHPLDLDRCPKGNCKIPQRAILRTCE